MKRYDLTFLLLAIFSLIAGVSLGIFMAMSHDYQLAPVHAHVNLVGWASLALFGLVYRAYPELGVRKLARFHLLLAAPAAILLPIGIALAILYNVEALAGISSFLWLGACLIFLLQLLSLFNQEPAA